MEETESSGPGGEAARPARVDDPVEAEHMAHAMKPHYERAKEIKQIRAEGFDTLQRQEAEDRSDVSPDTHLGSDPTIKAQAEDEAASAVERFSHVGDELIALDDAADHARKAGDAAGVHASQVYRRKNSE